MGRVTFEAKPMAKNIWIPIIRISEDGKDICFVMDGHFKSKDEAGEFIKWFWGLLSNKEKQKKFVYSKNGMSPEEMSDVLD